MDIIRLFSGAICSAFSVFRQSCVIKRMHMKRIYTDLHIAAHFLPAQMKDRPQDAFFGQASLFFLNVRDENILFFSLCIALTHTVLS